MKLRLLSLVLVAAIPIASCGGDAAAVGTVDARSARDLVGLPDTVILDIRTPEEFAEARIEGAVNIDFYAPDFADRISALDRGTTYVVYCRSGNRSGAAMDLFRDLDFTGVNELGGGILTWVQAGYPTISG